MSAEPLDAPEVERARLVAALEAALSVRPANWEDNNDPEQRRAGTNVCVTWERATGKRWD